MNNIVVYLRCLSQKPSSQICSKNLNTLILLLIGSYSIILLSKIIFDGVCVCVCVCVCAS